MLDRWKKCVQSVNAALEVFGKCRANKIEGLDDPACYAFLSCAIQAAKKSGRHGYTCHTGRFDRAKFERDKFDRKKIEKENVIARKLKIEKEKERKLKILI